MSLRRRVAILLVAVWFAGGVPLLSAGIDWQGVCSCDACPMAGGPGCCCLGTSLYGEGPGSAGKRAMLRTPRLDQGPGGCPAGEAALPGDTQSVDGRGALESTPRAAPEPASIASTPAMPGSTRPVLPLLPRPPPVSLRSL